MTKPYPLDEHHPAGASLAEFALLADYRVVRMTVDGAQVRLLQIRHPRLGWINFVVETNKARELARMLDASAPTKP